MSEFRWTRASEEAAQLVAAGNLTYPQVAESVGVSRQTVWAWRREPDFKARVSAHLEEIREEVRRVGLADVTRRVAALNDRWNRMRRVIEARADDPSMRDVPGGPTGLLVRSIRRVIVEEEDSDGQARKTSRDVEEFAVDTGLLKELRDHEKQAAQELGQWAERQQVTGADGGPLVVMKLGGAASMDDL